MRSFLQDEPNPTVDFGFGDKADVCSYRPGKAVFFV